MALAYLSLDFKIKNKKRETIAQYLMHHFMCVNVPQISRVDEQEPDIVEDTFLLVGKALVELGETIL